MINAWLAVLIPSALVGAVCAWKLHGKKALIYSAAIPWLGFLIWLLYNEYFVPYSGGGASMWPVAQLFAGTAAAFTGLIVCYGFQKLFQRLV